MLNIKNVSVHALCVALRWAKLNGMPNNMKNWKQEHSDKLQKVAEECDRRNRNRYDSAVVMGTQVHPD